MGPTLADMRVSVMKKILIILALILPLSGCVNQGRGWGYYPDSPFYGIRNLGDKIFEESWCPRCDRWGDRQVDKIIRDSSPWNPKGMAPGSCGAAYICDD